LNEEVIFNFNAHVHYNITNSVTDGHYFIGAEYHN